MKLIQSLPEMQAWANAERAAGRSIGLVPTMGALHAGHAALIRQAAASCDAVVVSVFVNPTQFGPQEDFAAYPRTLEADSQTAAAAGASVLFHPRADAMYPAGYATYVEVGGITDLLCGAARPGHFRGVATVVSKLLHLVQPHQAFFGQKDAQQVLVIRRMVNDLHWPVEIVTVPIVRDADGVALSSRNAYLTPAEREAACVLSRSLRAAAELVGGGERCVSVVRQAVLDCLATEPLAQVEYAAIYAYPDLTELEELEDKALLALAVRIGTTRLIDNTILEVTSC